MLNDDKAALIRSYVDAVARLDERAVMEMLHPKMRFYELPNRIRPQGGVDDLEALMAGLRRAGERKLLIGQRYILQDVIEAGERVVVEARWEGDLAVPVGRLKAGETMVAHICMVFRIKDGRIIEQRNYDCYDDFSAA